MSLNDKQARFAAEYLVDLNATQAAIRAGYSEATAYAQGCRLLKNVEVQRAIADGQAARVERTEITQDYVLQVILDTVERCRQARPVIDRKGNPVLVETPNGELAPAYTFNADSVLRGSELLGKHVGLFPNKVDLNVTTRTHEQALDELRSAIDGDAGSDVGRGEATSTGLRH